METKEMETSTAKKRELCHLGVERTLGGITVTCKSEILEDFFKNLSDNKKLTGTVGWGEGREFYDVKKISVPRGDYKNTINLQTYSAYNVASQDRSVLDFSFIRTVGLKDGIKISCKGLFLKEELEDMKSDFKTLATAIYLNYIKVSSFEITIMSNE